ncbi:MAG TPA: putative glycoside hydrolase, partial [Candidatus Magasanikbacteria bacterium]|nr:putative glycoside hydrolase [Candidatus Magasanikbacteria bacterium]
MKYVGIKILFLILFSAIIAPMNVFAVEKNPSVANFYLFTPINDSDARELAKWDVLILQMLAQENSAEQLRLIKKLNPKIIILAYIASEEFPVSMYKQWDKPGGLFYRLLSGITDEMWLRDSSGNHVTFWQDNWMLNATDYPTKNKRWNEYLAEFVNKEILSTGLWDGIFYDNVWESVDWINNKIDANNDRVADKAEVLNKNWANGMKKLFAL